MSASPLDPRPPEPTRKRLTAAQRRVLTRLAQRDGQAASRLSPSHSGNIMERLLFLGLVRLEVTPARTLAWLTPAGREALASGCVELG